MTLGNSRVGRRYPHGVVNNNQDEHVKHGIVGAIHTTTIEGFWSIIKARRIPIFLERLSLGRVRWSYRLALELKLNFSLRQFPNLSAESKKNGEKSRNNNHHGS
jgi:hypothetical protein